MATCQKNVLNGERVCCERGQLERDECVQGAQVTGVGRVTSGLLASVFKWVLDVWTPLPQCPPALLANVSASVLPTSADTLVVHCRALPSTSLIQSAVSHRISTLSHIARVRQAAQRGKSGEAELARLHSLNNEKAKGSSLWLQVLPTSAYLRLPDSKWQWAAQLRLGMPVLVYESSGYSGSGVCARLTHTPPSPAHNSACRVMYLG